MQQENEQAKEALAKATEQSKMESDALRAQIALDKQETAARVMRYCLNKICNMKYVAGWERWVAVHKAMVRAGRIMQRVMCKFTDNQTVMGWDRWLQVEGDQKRAAAIMMRCLVRIDEHYSSTAFSTWAGEVDQEAREEHFGLVVCPELLELFGRRQRQEVASQLVLQNSDGACSTGDHTGASS